MDINGSTNVDSLGGTPLNRDNLGLIQEWHWKFAQSTNLYTVPAILGALSGTQTLPSAPPTRQRQNTAKTWVSLGRSSSTVSCASIPQGCCNLNPMRGFFSGTWQVSHLSYPFITSETMPWPTTCSTLLKEPVICLRRNPASTHWGSTNVHVFGAFLWKMMESHTAARLEATVGKRFFQNGLPIA